MCSPGESENGRSDGTGTGVRFDDANQATLDHFTCHDIAVSAGAAGHGVYVHTTQVSPVPITNGVVSSVSGSCIHNAADLATARVGFIDVHGCGADAIVNATIEGAVYEEPPLFADPAAGDLHLLPISPLIDAGDHDAPYDAEPHPNGCRVNLGAYGNTQAATAAPAADDCP